MERADAAEGGAAGRLALSDGEIHYLWWFIQGSIMDVGTRWRLRRAWGLCARHAWGALATEAAFRGTYLHGPAILYEDLMERGVQTFRLRGGLQENRLARRLRATGPCMMCEMGLAAVSRSAAREELLVRGRDLRALLSFADRTGPYWRGTVCGRCAGTAAFPLCRSHLIEALSAGEAADLDRHRGFVRDILGHLRVYARSFIWEHQGTETDEDRAALLSAVGWCSGWGPWLALSQTRNPEDGAPR